MSKSNEEILKEFEATRGYTLDRECNLATAIIYNYRYQMKKGSDGQWYSALDKGRNKPKPKVPEIDQEDYNEECPLGERKRSVD